MREEQFKTWLEQHTKLQKRPIGDTVSRCKRIETIPGINLDNEYMLDGGSTIMELLSYSSEDKRREKPAPEGLAFAPGADLYSGLACLRKAVSRYFEFCIYSSKET